MPEPEAIPQEEPQEDLSRLVYMDDLTDIYNRRFLHRYLKEIVEWDAEQPDPLCLIMLDLDNFKQVNDTYGHLTGDNLLIHTAEILKKSFRENDIVIRYAGDEFSILLPDTDRQTAMEIAEKARVCFEKEDFERGDETVKGAVSISAGLARFPDDACSPEELIDRADKALYLSKESGRNRISDYAVMAAPAAAPPPAVEAPAPAPPPEPGEAPPAPAPAPPGAPPETAPEPMPAMKPAIHGHYRADEALIGNLMRAAGSVQDGNNTFILVKAGPNTGKIGVLSEFLHQAEVKGARCIVGTCNEQEKDMPYRPLFESLDRFLYKNVLEMDAIRAALSDNELGLLAREIPTLARKFDEVPVDDSISPLVYRYSFFDGVGKMLAALSEKRVFCVVLDELQFLDEGTRNIIVSVLRGGRGQVAFLGAIRPEMDTEGGDDGSTAARLISDLRGMEKAVEITLKPLDLAETTKLIDALIPDRAPGEGFDNLLWRASQGNPTYIETAVQVLAATEKIPFVNGQWITSQVTEDDLPGSLDELVRLQMGLLDEEAKEVVSHAAVVGSNVRLDVLEKMSGISEAEMLEIIDRARELGLLEFSERLSDDELKFISLKSHDATYDALDDQLKVEVHGKVADALQDIYKDHLEQASSALAHHYQKSGDEDKAQQFLSIGKDWAERMFNRNEIEEYARQKTEAARTKIAEFKEPLGEDQLPTVMQVLQALSRASKNLNQYPEGSQLITQAIDQMQQAVNDALHTIPGFTVGETKEGLLINAAPVDAKIASMTGKDVTGAMRERSIQSFTVTKGTGHEELLAFAKLFGMPPLKGTLSDDFWADNLRNADIEHIGVVQRAYVLDAQKARQTGMYKREFMEHLSKEAMAQACAAIRAMHGAMEKITLYPPGSQLITTAIEQLTRGLESVFAEVGGFSVTIVEGNLLINGTEPGSQVLGSVGMDFAKALQKAGLMSVMVSKEASLDEMTEFLRLVGAATEPKTEEEWKALLAESGITHILAGREIYSGSVAVVAPAPKTGEKVKDEAAPANADELIRQAQDMLEFDVPRLLDKESVAAMPPILEALVAKEKLELMRKLVGKYVSALSIEDPALREAAAAAVAGMYDKAGESAKTPFTAMTREAVIDALNKERVTAPFRHLLGMGASAAAACVGKRDYLNLNTIVRAIRKDPEGGADQEMGELAREALTKLAESQGFKDMTGETAAEGFKYGSEVIAVVESLNDIGVPILIDMIKATNDPNLGLRAAEAVHARGQEAEEALLSELKTDADPTPCRRIIAVLDKILTDPVPALKELILHPSDKVRKDVLPRLANLDPKTVSEMLLEAARSTDPQVAAAAIEALGDFSCTEAVNGLCDMVKTSRDTVLQKAACVALGNIAGTDALGTLREIIESKRLMGLSTVFPNEVRSAAVWALRGIPGAEVKALLEKLAKDRSPEVKSAAMAALEEHKG